MFLFTCFISFFLWHLYKWSQIDFNFRREGGRFKILIIEIICIEFLMLFTVRPCPLCLPQPLLWPRRPGSGHGSHVGGGGSGQGSSRRSGGGGTGVNTAGAGGGAGGGSGGAPASAGGGGGSSAAASAGGVLLLLLVVAAGAALLLLLLVAVGAVLLLAVGAALSTATADCSQKFVIVSKGFYIR